MIKQEDIPAYGTHRAMTVVAYTAKAVANLQQGDNVTIEHVALLNGTNSTASQLHSATHRTRPPGSTFTIRTVANGVVVYRSC